LEADGNVVLYTDGKSTWNSGSGRLPTQDVGCLFIDIKDGKLIAEYASGASDDPPDYWSTVPDEAAVDAGAPFTAVIKDDGNLEITRGDGAVIWSTNTTAQGEDT
jgi:hypothetical protein